MDSQEKDTAKTAVQADKPTQSSSSLNSPLNPDILNQTPRKVAKPKKPFYVLIAAIPVVLLIVTFVLLKSTEKTADRQISQTSITPVTQSAAVNITADGFVPATIKIKKNQSITWTNQDISPHQIATDPYPSEDGLAGFKSEEPVGKGEIFNYTFDKVGTFTYHDRLNPFKFNGTVVVE